MALRDDGAILMGEDWLSSCQRGHKKVHDTGDYALRFHLGPGIRVQRGADETEALAWLQLPDGSQWSFAAEGGALSVKDSLWLDGYALPHTTQQLVLSGQANERTHIQWQFTRVG
jgi:uncharacterized heparinase superfamily protein